MASVILTWSANPETDNVIAYDIFGANGTSVVFGSCAFLASVNATTWTDTGLANGQARTYYLVARNAVGSSAPDGPFNITTAAVSGLYVQNAGSAPSLQEGLLSARPAAGHANALYLTTDTKALYRDNGASWDVIAGGGSVIDGIGFNTTGLFKSAEVLGAGRFSHNVAFPSTLQTSYVTAKFAPAADAVLNFQVAGVTVGTITFGAGLTTGVIAWGGGYTLTAGTIITLVAPSPADASLSGLTGTIQGDPA
jgi:hypothetical protein